MAIRGTSGSCFCGDRLKDRTRRTTTLHHRITSVHAASSRTLAQPAGARYPAIPVHKRAIRQAEHVPEDKVGACSVTRRFFDCLNNRDLSGMFTLLANDVEYNNPALQVHHVGKQATVRWYGQVLSSLPELAALVVDDIVPIDVSNSTGLHHVTVTWHLEVGGLPVPGSEGVGQLRLDPAMGCVTSIKDAPQAAVRVLLPALSLASPAINALSPVWMPAVDLLRAGGQTDGGMRGLQPPSAPDFLLNAASTLTGMLPSPPTVLPWVTDLYGSQQGAANSASRPVPHDHTSSSRSSAPHSSRPLSQPHTHTAQATSSYTVPTATNTSGAYTATRASSSLSATALPAGPATYARGASATSDDVSAKPGISLPTPSNKGTSAGLQKHRLSAQTNVIQMRTLATPAINTSLATATGLQAKVVEAVAFEMSEEEEETVVQASFEDITPTAPNLTGLWEKDPDASQPEAYERMLDVLGLSGLQRVTARLIEGIEIKDEESSFCVNFVTVVPFFKVTERVKFGSPVRLMRRDLKPGNQTAIAQRIAGGVRIVFNWSEPNAGTLTEDYTMATDGDATMGKAGEMLVTSQLSVGGRSAVVAQVYRRSGKNREQLLKESRARNSSMESVLARQKAKWGN